MTDRKYAMTKLHWGDYLLPSNDTQTIWRINRYDDPDTSPPHGWQVHRLRADHLQRLMDSAGDDPWDWSHWDYYSGGHRSRAEAVADALGADL